jgi:dTDP-4-amino-4,6-dideoxygalactose transaminase
MSSPDITELEVRAVSDVLRTAHLALGPRTEEFEEAFARRMGARHAVAVSSGTAGLHLATIAAGVRCGDFVITSPFSFVASANCVLYERGIPVFVDVDPVTGNMDAGLAVQAARRILMGTPPGTLRRVPPEMAGGTLKAFLPVHAFGQPSDVDALASFAASHGLAVIEDACEAVGAELRGRPVGALGDLGVFAFYPNKQMTTGEGGLILTSRDDWARLLRSLRNQGRDVFDAWLTHSRLGYNYRMDELSGALGLAQLSRLDELLAKRERVAAWYVERLAELEWVACPTLAPSTTRMSWFVFVVRLENGIDRPALIDSLTAAGVPSRPYFTPIHLQPVFAETFGYRPGDLPVAERLGDRSLALPFSSVMTEEQVEYVCGCLRDAIERQLALDRTRVAAAV